MFRAWIWSALRWPRWISSWRASARHRRFDPVTETEWSDSCTEAGGIKMQPDGGDGSEMGRWVPYPLPSGKLTVCYWKWPFIVDLPIKNGDFPWFFVSLPKGTLYDLYDFQFEFPYSNISPKKKRQCERCWTCAGAAAWHCDRIVSFLTWNLLGEAFNSWHFSLENVSYLSCLDEIQYLFSKGWSWWSCMRHRCSICHAIPEYQS